VPPAAAPMSTVSSKPVMASRVAGSQSTALTAAASHSLCCTAAAVRDEPMVHWTTARIPTAVLTWLDHDSLSRMHAPVDKKYHCARGAHQRKQIMKVLCMLLQV
jgi:hypothetical protein